MRDHFDPPGTRVTGHRRTPAGFVGEVPLWCWVVGRRWSQVSMNRATRAARGDRGDVLGGTVLAVGMVIVAGLILAVLKNKGLSIANGICTNADPTTC